MQERLDRHEMLYTYDRSQRNLKELERGRKEKRNFERRLQNIRRELKTLYQKRELEAYAPPLRRRLTKPEKIKKEAREHVVVSATLYAPAYIGEQALLDTYHGEERGSIIANSFTRMLMFNKKQLIAFAKRKIVQFDEFLERLRAGSVLYYPYEKVKSAQMREVQWAYYKHSMMRRIPKLRWPFDKRRLRNVGGGTEISEELIDAGAPR